MKKLLIILGAIALIAVGCGQKQADSNAAQATVNEESILDTAEAAPDEFVGTVEKAGTSYEATALGIACSEGNLSEVKRLIADGANRKACLEDDYFQYDALYTAVCFEQPDIVQYLIELKENVNSIYTEAGVSILSIACGLDNKPMAIQIAKLLLEAGANVKGDQDLGFDYEVIYPIDRARMAENDELVKLLESYGA
jgi:ankyrin repeat protein